MPPGDEPRGFLEGLSAQNEALTEAMRKLTPELAAELARSCTATLRPGEVLAVRLPLSVSPKDVVRARAYALAIEEETGIKVAFIPGEEFAHTTVTIDVHMHGVDASQIVSVVREEIIRYNKRRGGGSSLSG